MNTIKSLQTSLVATVIGALGLSAGVTASGCTVDAADPLFILHNLVPDGDCALNANKDERFISRGVLDTDSRRIYLFTPLVQSRAEVFDSTDPLQRAIFIEGAEIDISIPDGAADIGALDADGQLSFTQRFSGTVEPGGLSTFAFEIIPAAVAESIDSRLTAPDTVQVLVDIKMIGELGGGDITSPVFTYPITFCKGCRLAAPSCVGYEPPDQLSCFPGQDNFAVECCISSAGQLECPPAPEDAPEQQM